MKSKVLNWVGAMSSPSWTEQMDRFGGMTAYRRVVEILEGITFYAGDFTDMLVTAYRQLALYGIVEESEIIALNAWIEDVKGVI